MRILGYHQSAPYICTPLVPIFHEDGKYFIAITDKLGNIQAFKDANEVNKSSLITTSEFQNKIYKIGNKYPAGFRYDENKSVFGDQNKIVKRLKSAVNYKNIDQYSFISLEIAIACGDKESIKTHTYNCWKTLSAIDMDYANNWLSTTPIPKKIRDIVIHKIGSNSAEVKTKLSISGPFYFMQLFTIIGKEHGFSNRVDFIRRALLSFVDNPDFFYEPDIKKIEGVISTIHHHIDANIPVNMHNVAHRSLSQSFRIEASIIPNSDFIKKNIIEKSKHTSDLLIKSNILSYSERTSDAVFLINLIYLFSILKKKYATTETCIELIENTVRSEIGGARSID